MNEVVNKIKKNPISISVVITLVINIITVVRFVSKLDSRIASLENADFLTKQEWVTLKQQIDTNRETNIEIKDLLRDINRKLDDFILSNR